ncbi:MAG: hypothetical protein SF123_06360 [Chloroflexota bacterium]|nr:hypothetical protein [Chloroflexota bacterium]
MHKWFLACLILLLTGCMVRDIAGPNLPRLDAQVLWDNPEPIPDHIEDVVAITLAATGEARQMCANIQEFYIWEEGEHGSDTF